MENGEVLLVVSKLKKWIKDQAGLSTSQTYVDCLSQYLAKESLKAADKARAQGRKTVMDRDFSFFDVSGEEPDENLVVISKVKKLIKDQGLATSAQCFPVISKGVLKVTQNAMANAQKSGRKTVMDKDFTTGI